MQRTNRLTGITEIQVTPGELARHLREQYRFLWHFARKMSRCRRCGGVETEAGPYRIYINGRGDFAINHRCGSCHFPVRSYVDMSQEHRVRRRIHQLWQSKFN
jgi:hypothetical protein